ncbi:FAD-binding domain [Mycobacterium sp. 4D054]|uniref:FAD-binding domain n=1 Tax=unclassified Mycobacterium TaxID=2642494 RepID=UPI0021B44DC9|nr:FAD-binding domain [Mycobacterium sp. SMC-8]UXA09880.1 FAD-binding domain [Mycobacterium sp. SMC-8]
MRIAISGAGVAGPALAYWLHRSGHTPTLIEKAPALRTGGYMIDFWGLGYQVVKRMGLADSVRAAGYDIQSIRNVGPDGEINAELGVDMVRRAIGGDFTSLLRGDLSAALYAATAGTVETIFGDIITGIDEDADGVRLHFDQSRPRDYDLLVGADGLHSAVRHLAFGPEENYARYLGAKVAACEVTGYRPRDELVYVNYSTPGRQVARIALRDDRTMFLFVFRDDRDDSSTSALSQLREHFGGAGWECPQILSAIDGVDDLYFDAVSQIQMPRWSRGRVVLIGDAAGCISLLGGEGTGLAITEAYVLAGELMRASDDHRVAFEAYEHRMRPLIEAKQAAARRFLGFFATRTRLGLRFRDMSMRALKWRPFAKLVTRGVRDDVSLPDYELR